MALDKLVDSSQLDTDLASVANAIRTKGGTSAQLAFPAGFVSAVQAIPTGGTPTGTKQISITANGTTTEDVAAYANAEITVNVPTGGGGSAETLLGSGTYTVSAVASSATISTGITNSDETKPVKILVVKDSQTSGVGQMLWWANVYPVGPDDFVNQAGVNFAQAYYVASNGTSYGYCNYTYNSATSVICYFTRSTGKITLRQYANNYRIQPDTYHWYVWGEAVTL